MSVSTTSAARRAARRRRRGRLAVTLSVLAMLALIGWLASVAWESMFKKHVVADSCQVVGMSTGTVYAMDPEQLLNASIIADVAMRRGLPQRAIVVALATAQQESKLRNLDYGDADSIGLFQQRPSQGWGTRDQIMVPTYAAGKFYDALLKVPHWQTLPVTQAADAVQHSAFPDAYKDWEPRATALSAALAGTTSGQLSCRLAHPGVLASSASDPSSSTTTTTTTISAATTAVTSDLGQDLQITSPRVTPVSTTRATVSVTGLAAPASGDDTTAKHRTTTVAAWAVANATSHGITSVVVGNQEWRPDRGGWRAVKLPAPDGAVVLTVSKR